MNQVLFVGDPPHECRAVVLDAAGLFTARPAVAVAEMKVAREHRVGEGDVALHHGGLDLPFESQDFRRVARGVGGGHLGRRRRPSGTTTAAGPLSLGRLTRGLCAERQAGNDKRNEHRYV